MSEESKMSFLEHLEELRKRLIICAVSVFAGMIICWFFREQILSFLLDPLYSAWRQVDGLDEPKPLNFSSMLEPFIAYLKLSAIGGLFLASPVVLFQLWRFVSPGLYPKEKKFALPFVLVSTVLFVGGSTMAYSMVFPIGFRFFLEFAAGQKMTTVTAEVTIAGTDDPPPTGSSSPAVLPPPPSASKADAGADASVTDEALPVPPKPNAAPTTSAPSTSAPGAPPKAAPAWWETVFNMLAATECAQFKATENVDGDLALLTIRWEEPRCGKPNPEWLTVRRDGEKLMPVWNPAVSDTPGVRVLEARDPVSAGRHSYALSYPTNPNAHRLAPVLMVKDYLAFAVRLLLAFGLIFELPIFISFLAIAGIVDYKQLIRFSRYFFVLSVVVGALLTPPDVVTQLLLATPLMVLYTLSIGVAYLFGERPRE